MDDNLCSGLIPCAAGQSINSESRIDNMFILDAFQGISFCLIIVRIGLGTKERGPAHLSLSAKASRGIRSPIVVDHMEIPMQIRVATSVEGPYASGESKGHINL